MALNLNSKKAVVAEVADYAKKALAAVGAQYSGLNVAELTKLRVQAKQANVYLRVVKNSLAKRAIKGTGLECIADELKGPLILAFAMEAPGAAARLIYDFAKKNDQLITKVIAFDGKSVAVSQLGMLASLPTKDEGIALIMAVMKEPIGKLARTLAAVKTQMEAA